MAAILIRKKRGRSKGKLSDFIDEFASNEKLPPTSHVKEDLVLGVLSAGKSVNFLKFFFEGRGLHFHLDFGWVMLPM
jgi:hypothetical protein